MIPASSPRTLTISIPRNAITHALIGAALVGLAAGAIALHMTLASGSPHRAALLAIGGLAGAGAGVYWLRCTLQRIRADQLAGLQALEQQAERDRIRAAQASAILEAFEQAHRDHKLAAEQRRELIGAIEALQDCYLNDGIP